MDKITEVLISTEGQEVTYTIPRENLGSYVIDLSTHETRLTKLSEVINIDAGGIGSYMFNFKVDTTKLHGTAYHASPTDMLKTDWLKSKLVVKYYGKNKMYALQADLKEGVESKEVITLY